MCKRFKNLSKHRKNKNSISAISANPLVASSNNG